jgi:hypothetical protein
MTDRTFERANDESRARLARLVERLRPAQLTIDLGGGWTVASALAHTGFWDRWQAERWTEMLAGTWSAVDASVLASENLANVAIDPYWSGIGPAGIPALALDAATKLDALIARAPDSMVESLEGSPSAYLLHRYRHRGDHLDQIERALEAGGGAVATASVATASDGSYLARNEASRARLEELLAKLSAEDLSRSSGEGDWTVGQLIGHLAFWDRFLAARWRAALASGGAQPGTFAHELADVLNDGLPPTWGAYASAAPASAIADTIDAARAIDGLIASLPEATPVAAILADRPALLDRSIHRLEHIETMEKATAGRR